MVGSLTPKTSATCGSGLRKHSAYHRGPLDLIVRATAASSYLLQQSPLAVGELNQGGARTSWFAHRYSPTAKQDGID